MSYLGNRDPKGKDPMIWLLLFDSRRDVSLIVGVTEQ